VITDRLQTEVQQTNYRLRDNRWTTYLGALDRLNTEEQQTDYMY